MDKASLPKGCRIMFIVKDGKEHYLRAMTDETGEPPATAEEFLKGVNSLYSQVVGEAQDHEVESARRDLESAMGYETEDREEFEAEMNLSVIPSLTPATFRETVMEWYKSHSPKELREDEDWEMYLPDLMCRVEAMDEPREWEEIQE